MLCDALRIVHLVQLEDEIRLREEFVPEPGYVVRKYVGKKATR